MQALSALILHCKHRIDGMDIPPIFWHWSLCFDDIGLVAQRLCQYHCMTRLDHYEWDNGAVSVLIETQSIPVGAITVEPYPTFTKDPYIVQM